MSEAREFEVWRGYTAPTVRVRLFAFEGFGSEDMRRLLPLLLEAQLKAFEEACADERQEKVSDEPPVGEEAAPA